MSHPTNAMARLLDLARWAPSGDNTQPWRFEVRDDTHLVLHGHDTRTHCVYDLDGHASQLAIGCLIETLSIAASGFQWRMGLKRREGLPDCLPTFDIAFVHDRSVQVQPLLREIPRRTVNRRPFRTSPLTREELAALTEAVGPAHALDFLAGWRGRLRAAGLMFRNAKIRLTTEEAYRVHADIIDWGKRYSTDRVPDQALGADRLTLRLMQWAMHDWQRVQRMNRFAAGTWIPRLQLDVLPSLFCAAHAVIVRRTAPTTVDDYVDAGRAVQRFWLTASALGLQHQPEMTPLIFSRYVREKRVFSQAASAQVLAEQTADLTRAILGPAWDRAVWLGRVGRAAAPPARSVRKSRDELSQLRPPANAALPSR